MDGRGHCHDNILRATPNEPTCLGAQRDSVVADDIDAHEWLLLIDSAAVPP